MIDVFKTAGCLLLQQKLLCQSDPIPSPLRHRLWLQNEPWQLAWLKNAGWNEPRTLKFGHAQSSTIPNFRAQCSSTHRILELWETPWFCLRITNPVPIDIKRTTKMKGPKSIGVSLSLFSTHNTCDNFISIGNHPLCWLLSYLVWFDVAGETLVHSGIQVMFKPVPSRSDGRKSPGNSQKSPTRQIQNTTCSLWNSINSRSSVFIDGVDIWYNGSCG